MKTVRLQRVKITGRKHLLFGKTDEGYLFVIRHLVAANKQMKGFNTFYKREKIKISDNVFHVTDETFKTMTACYFSMYSNIEKIPSSFDVKLNYD